MANIQNQNSQNSGYHIKDKEVRDEEIKSLREALCKKQASQSGHHKKAKIKNIIGKKIIHKWSEDGEEKWFEGTVNREVEPGVFDVNYKDDEEYEVELQEDMEKGEAFVVD